MKKLPPHPQEASISKGSRCNQERDVAFPPFAFFADFVRGGVKMKIEPRFTLSSEGGAVSKQEINRKRPLSVHVTWRDKRDLPRRARR